MWEAAGRLGYRISVSLDLITLLRWIKINSLGSLTTFAFRGDALVMETKLLVSSGPIAVFMGHFAVWSGKWLVL